MLRKFLLIFFVLFFSIFLVSADSNGIWDFAQNLRGKNFGGDELNVSNFTFQNNVYLEKLIFTNEIYFIENINYYLDLNFESFANNLFVNNIFINESVRIGRNNVSNSLFVDGKIKFYENVSDFDKNSTVINKKYLKKYLVKEIGKIDLAAYGNDAYKLLYLGIHNGSECMEQGGAVAIANGVYICKIEYPTCPNGWTRYENWGGTASTSISGYVNRRWIMGSNKATESGWRYLYGTITTGSHYWANTALIESKPYTFYDTGESGTIYARVARVACY